jgi:hypothetical protein
MTTPQPPPSSFFVKVAFAVAGGIVLAIVAIVVVISVSQALSQRAEQRRAVQAVKNPKKLRDGPPSGNSSNPRSMRPAFD